MKLAVKLAISLAIILYVLLVQVEEPEAILGALTGVDPWPLAIAFSLHFVGLYLSALRWQILLRVQEIECRIWPLVLSYLVGGFFNLFLPTRVGGDVVRGLDTRKAGHSAARPFGVIVVERVTGMFTLLLFSVAVLASGFAFPGKEDVTLGVSAVLLAMLVGAGALFLRPLTRLLQRMLQLGRLGKFARLVGEFHQSLTIYARHPGPFVRALAVGAALQVNYVLHYYFIGEALGLQLDAAFYFVMVPIMSVVLMIPITFSGVGLREEGNLIFFRLMGRTPSQAVAFSALSFAMIVVFGVLGGVIYALRTSTPVEDRLEGRAAVPKGAST